MNFKDNLNRSQLETKKNETNDLSITKKKTVCLSKSWINTFPLQFLPSHRHEKGVLYGFEKKKTYLESVGSIIRPKEMPKSIKSIKKQ
jgi:hypothetical protein